jgi:hypothetical protein
VSNILVNLCVRLAPSLQSMHRNTFINWYDSESKRNCFQLCNYVRLFKYTVVCHFKLLLCTFQHRTAPVLRQWTWSCHVCTRTTRQVVGLWSRGERSLFCVWLYTRVAVLWGMTNTQCTDETLPVNLATCVQEISYLHGVECVITSWQWLLSSRNALLKWKPKVDYGVHRSLLQDAVLSQMCPFHKFTLCVLKVRVLFFHLYVGLLSSFLYWDILT